MATFCQLFRVVQLSSPRTDLSPIGPRHRAHKSSCLRPSTHLWRPDFRSHVPNDHGCWYSRGVSTETPDQTIARLRSIANAEAAAAVASGVADAVGLTGSASSGRLWPSSDLDLLFMSERITERWFRWTSRDGIILHGVVTPWKELEDFRELYPGRMIDTATWGWILDATWQMDGLVGMRILHDPSGRLEAMQAFMAAHRFAPEVVAPRRPLLLARARAEHRKSLDALDSHPREAHRLHHHVIDILGVIWLEAGRRITSHKELDATLGEIGPALGIPDLQVLFRKAEGVETFLERRTTIEQAFGNLLDLYSPALDGLLTGYPTGDGACDWKIADHVYPRHMIQSVPHALEHRCLLHVAALKESLTEYELSWVPLEAAKRGLPAPVSPDRLNAARESAMATLIPAPWESRQRALDELFSLTAAL